MKTFTFTFIEEGHGSIAVVTAETEKDCREKYFLKYPDRLDSPGLDVLEGDHDYGFALTPKQ